MKKRVLLIVFAMVLVAALSVGLTLAYLTSQDSVTNTFTVGQVNITMDEARAKGYVTGTEKSTEVFNLLRRSVERDPPPGRRHAGRRSGAVGVYF